MVSRRNFYLLSILAIVVMLGLSACVRPVPGDDETTPPDTTDVNVGGGTDGGQTQPDTEGGDQTGETQPDTEGGDQTGETQPDTEGGDQSGETQPDTEGGDTSAPATGGQPEQGGGTIGTPPTTEVIHTVQPGENLFRIGLQYGYSWVVLARYNGIPNPNYIYVGQPIRIPAAGGGGGGGQPPTDGNYSYYVVQPGDNLFRIGLKFGMSWIFIAEANGLTNPNYLVPGQVLKIPVVATPYGS